MANATVHHCCSQHHRSLQVACLCEPYRWCGIACLVVQYHYKESVCAEYCLLECKLVHAVGNKYGDVSVGKGHEWV